MEKLKADVVVIGGGAAGLVAALSIAERNANVILFEKNQFLGGISRLGMGFHAVERERALEWFNEFMNHNGWRLDARLVRAFIFNTQSVAEWLMEHGVQLEKIESGAGGLTPLKTPSIMYLVKGKDDVHGPSKMLGGSTAHLIAVLAKRAKEMGVEIRTSCPVKKIYTENGRVSGVLANGLQVDCKAVIIASGGYPDNPEMLESLTGFKLGSDIFLLKRAQGLRLMGDGIRMALELGASFDYTAPQLVFIPGEDRGWFAEPDLMAAVWGQPSHLWINQNGERFINEEAAQNRFYAAHAIARQKNRVAYCIFDENIKERMETGLDNIPYLWYPPKVKIDDLDAAIERARKKGIGEGIYVENSIDELANKIGVDPNILKRTIEEYNYFCEKGHDDFFGKNPKFLIPIKKPRFYAFRLRCSMYGTVGGIKINERAEVLNKEGEVIPGLYAAGDCANSIGALEYHLTGGLAFALVSGRIAAENALNYVHRTS
jgi:fumarate reductase flavoprotein subunit